MIPVIKEGRACDVEKVRNQIRAEVFRTVPAADQLSTWGAYVLAATEVMNHDIPVALAVQYNCYNVDGVLLERLIGLFESDAYAQYEADMYMEEGG